MAQAMNLAGGRSVECVVSFYDRATGAPKSARVVARTDREARDLAVREVYGAEARLVLDRADGGYVYADSQFHNAYAWPASQGAPGATMTDRKMIADVRIGLRLV